MKRYTFKIETRLIDNSPINDANKIEVFKKDESKPKQSENEKKFKELNYFLRGFKRAIRFGLAFI